MISVTAVTKKGGVHMRKKFLATCIACCFFSATLPMSAVAAPRLTQDEVLENILLYMKHDLELVGMSGDVGQLHDRTRTLIDALLVALEDDDLGLVQECAIDLALEAGRLQAQQSETQCQIPLILGVSLASIAILGDIASGAATGCIVLNVTNSIADIISDFHSYNICLIDNEENPDMAARDAIVQQQVVVETYDFMTNALDVAYCVEEPGAGDYLGLFFNFLGIFPSAPPETEQALAVR